MWLWPLRVAVTLQQANLDKKALKAVELVGGGTRMPAVVEVLKAFFGFDAPLRLTMDTETSVCQGAVLMGLQQVRRECAILACHPQRKWLTNGLCGFKLGSRKSLAFAVFVIFLGKLLKVVLLFFGCKCKKEEWKKAHGIFPIILQVFPNKKTCSQIAAGILQSELRCATDHWTNCVLHLFFAPGRQWSALTISTSRHLLTPLPAPLSSRPFLNEQTKVLKWMPLWEHFFLFEVPIFTPYCFFFFWLVSPQKKCDRGCHWQKVIEQKTE